MFFDKMKRKYVVAEKKTVGEYEIVDHGVQNSQYFQGCGVAHTDFTDCATGIGNSLKGALEDAADSLAQNGWALSKDLEHEIETASDEDEVSQELNRDRPAETFTVTHHSNAMGSRLTKEEFDTEAEAKQAVEKIVQSCKRKGLQVEQLNDTEWEVTEPDDAVMVPDESGIIKITTNEDELAKFDERADDAEVSYYASIRVKE